MQKLGDDCQCECDVPPPWVGVGITSPVRKIKGNFLSKRFTSSGTESGMCCVAMGAAASETIAEGSTACELLGKNDLAMAGAIAEQYLAGLWSNSNSELSQEINAQNGTCHCGLQKFDCEKLVLKLDGF